MCEQATCYIYDYEKKELWSRVAKGTHEVIRINAGQGIPGRSIYKNLRLGCVR